MRIAILSDIHGNLEALTKALSLVAERGVDSIICLGDTVGYGANPNECLDLMMKATPNILLGNHDEAAVNLDAKEEFNSMARTAIEWTADVLTKEHKDYLSVLPYTLELEGALFVHASPHEPEQWHYIISPMDAHKNFYAFTEQICFVGHTHAAAVFGEDVWARNVEQGKRFIVNVGSVGQPRDMNPRLSFGIFDTAEWKYENVRSEYDVETASEKIRAAGLPRMLADRLLVGR
jgi:diadenosine tetraphosphatase ApaH/serine/threonine PP2A family protein phosphatase